MNRAAAPSTPSRLVGAVAGAMLAWLPGPADSGTNLASREATSPPRALAAAAAPAGATTGPRPARPPALRRPAARSTRVTFVGDSITAWGDWQRRFPDAAITNAGRPGDTTIDLLARLATVRDGRPELALLMVGINDLLRGARVEAVAERVLRIRQLVADAGRVRVIQQSTLACEASRCGAVIVARVRQLNRLLRAGVPSDDFLDVDAALSDATGLRAAYSLDGLHLTPAGYRRWQELLRSRFGSQLGRSSPVP